MAKNRKKVYLSFYYCVNDKYIPKDSPEIRLDKMGRPLCPLCHKNLRMKRRHRGDWGDDSNRVKDL